ncbi:hypothetical protein UPYG_G00239540, partial [Umbra pygmaea]
HHVKYVCSELLLFALIVANDITTVSTTQSTTVTDAQIRLVNGNTACSGRVEVYYRGSWGTVCDDSWDLNDAQVVCRQLRCGRALSAPMLAAFGVGNGTIWMDDVGCTGNESSLTQCRHNGFGIHDCSHSEDAGAVCSANDITTVSTTQSTTVTDAQIRLVNGNNSCSGRVEVYYRGSWGTVCDDSWDLNDAQVVCRQLRCGRALSAPMLAAFGVGNGTIWMDDVGCTGNESSLTQCRHNGFGIHNCVHGEDAGAVCSGSVRPSISELECERSFLKVGLNQAQLQTAGLNASSAHLADQRCSNGRVTNGTLWFQVTRREGICGNILRTNNTHAIYSNSLFVYRDSFSQAVSFPFSCAYPLDTETSLDVAIAPYLPLEGVVSGAGPKARAFMSLYHTQNYTETYPGGQRISLPLGSPLYVGVSVEDMETNRFVVVLDDCYATHTPTPDDQTKYSLIQDKCPVDPTLVRVDENGSSLRARFSALLVLYNGTYQDIYLHCTLSLCDTRSSFCSPYCSRNRISRSISSSSPYSVTLGPVTWL